MKYLLRRDPEERLGCNKEQGFNQIKQHPFFNVLDWDLLEQRQVRWSFYLVHYLANLSLYTMVPVMIDWDNILSFTV